MTENTLEHDGDGSEMTQVCKTRQEFQRARAAFKRPGLVPTMGYLHEGHLSLVRQARAECDAVVVSIFVNPTQFGPNEDLVRYPRDSERDIALLQKEGVDLVFLPDVAEMYPHGYKTYICVEGLSEQLEGTCRPGHFCGVATIVCKLLNMVQPARVYFGQKDAQQVVVVRTMVRDLNIPTEIVVCPTVREQDGLALSSRNVYLSRRERQAATVLYRALEAARRRYEKGIWHGEALREAMRQTIDFEPLANADYVSAADPETLEELDWVNERGILLSLAVRIGTNRLIDNMLLEPPASM